MAESQEAIGVTEERIHHSEGTPGGGVALKIEVTTVPAKESVELLEGGNRAYPAMLSAIAHARTSVDLEVYTFAPLGVGPRFVEALGNAARRGVAVRVVIDGWGSARDGRAVANTLRQAGCAVRIHNRPLSLLLLRFARNHRKILLVDETVAFSGGINIGDENLDPLSVANLEALVEVSDAPVVAQGEGWIQNHLAGSPAITAVEANGSLRRWLLDPFGHVVAWLAAAFGLLVAGRRTRRTPSHDANACHATPHEPTRLTNDARLADQ